MDITSHQSLEDGSGLNAARMRIKGVVYGEDSLDRLAKETLAEGSTLTVAGRRHSQGGHTLKEGGTCLDTDGLREIRIQSVGQKFADAGAAATWNDLHLLLDRGGSRLAPETHQSSALFSVGGSLAVNCHGRFPERGPVAQSVLSMRVWTPAHGVLDITPKDALFALVLGGCGAGAIILSARIRLVQEQYLEHKVQHLSFKDYTAAIHKHIDGGHPRHDDWPIMHYAWLEFSESGLFDTVISVDSVRAVGNADDEHEPLVHDSTLETTILREAYSLVRRTSGTPRDLAWAATVTLAKSRLERKERMLNAMRAPIRFARLVDEDSVDLMQEFIVPVWALPAFVRFTRDVLRQYQVNLLSATIRYVTEDDVSILSYAQAPLNACIVLNVNAPKRQVAPLYRGSTAPSPYVVWNRLLIDEAIRLQGAFYLPYWPCATDAQLQSAFGAAAWQRFVDVRKEFDPGHALTNQFLDRYAP